jgi:hypothetical protein
MYYFLAYTFIIWLIISICRFTLWGLLCSCVFSIIVLMSTSIFHNEFGTYRDTVYLAIWSTLCCFYCTLNYAICSFLCRPKKSDTPQSHGFEVEKKKKI